MFYPKSCYSYLKESMSNEVVNKYNFNLLKLLLLIELVLNTHFKQPILHICVSCQIIEFPWDWARGFLCVPQFSILLQTAPVRDTQSVD